MRIALPVFSLRTWGVITVSLALTLTACTPGDTVPPEPSDNPAESMESTESEVPSPPDPPARRAEAMDVSELIQVIDYDTFDPDETEVIVPEALQGYRDAVEDGVSRQWGKDIPAHGSRHAVTARDPVAARVGLRVLQGGGNAADAAFAVGAALSVTEPWFSHALGGGTWALYRENSGAVHAVDGAGTIGSLADAEYFRESENLPAHGMVWTIVPGAWDAWMVWLERFGTMELDTLLAPAVDLAGEGAPASRTMVAWIAQQRDSIANRPASAAIFLPGNEVPAAGQMFIQEELEKTFKMIIAAYRAARPGGREAAFQAARDVYYRGPIGRAVARYSRRNGGSLTDDDFAAYEAVFRKPLVTKFAEWTLYNPPPGSQGIVMPMALNIISHALPDPAAWDDPDTIHVIAEAMNLAHIDKHHYIGDPDSMEMPLERLLSSSYGAEQAERITPTAALQWPQQGGLDVGEHNTTTFSVVDRWGNGAAVTTSVGAQFVVAGETGIVVNQRLQNVFYDEDNPNSLVPGRRVRHTVNPYIAELPGRRIVLGGNTGYDTQPQGQIQQFLNIARFGANAQEAVSRPRYIVHSFPDITYPHTVGNQLALEWGFPENIAGALAEKGHNLSRGAIFGNGNVIIQEITDGTIEAGADHRGENLALAE